MDDRRWGTGRQRYLAAMTALIDSASNNLLVSLNQSFVLSAVNEGDHWGLLGVAPNDPDGYLHLV